MIGMLTKSINIIKEVIVHEPLMEFAALNDSSPLDVLKSESVLNRLSAAFVGVYTNGDGDIVINGAFVKVIMLDIFNEWHTSAIEKQMFKSISTFSVTADRFFAVELLYMFTKLAESKVGNRLKYSKLAEQLYENTWLKEAAERPTLTINYKAIKDQLNITLLPVQNNYLTRYAEAIPRMNLRGNVLGSAPGSGKTIAGFAWGLAFDIDILIFIVPKNSLHQVWESTVNSVFKKKKKYWISSGSEPITGKEDYIICHYESMALVRSAIRKLKGKIGIWVDESHNFNEDSSIRTQMLIDICTRGNVSAVTLASGTPLKAVAREASSMLAAICYDYTYDVAERFKKSLARTSSAGDIIRNRLSYSVFSVPKHDIVKNEVTYTTYPITFKGMERFTLKAVKLAMSAYIAERVIHYNKYGPGLIDDYIMILERYGSKLDASEKYDYNLYISDAKHLHLHFNPWTDGDIVIRAKRYEREFIEKTLQGDELKEFRKTTSIYKYPALVIRGEALGHVLTRERIECFNALTRHADIASIIKSSRKKTVIFSSYVDTVEVAAAVCRKAKLKPIIVHGTAKSTLDVAVAKFTKSKLINPIIATYKSLSTAVPLISASTLILINHPYRDYEWQQATARVDRLGQDGPVEIVDLVLDTGEDPNLSTRGKDIMTWSKEATEFLLGDTFIVIASDKTL